MPSVTTPRLAKSDQLLSVVSDYQACLIVTHDNPDPDAIASGWGIQCLVTEKLGIPTRFIGGGAIVRAENRHMVERFRRGEMPMETFHDGLAVVEMLMALYRSAELGRNVVIGEEDLEAYVPPHIAEDDQDFFYFGQFFRRIQGEMTPVAAAAA